MDHLTLHKNEGFRRYRFALNIQSRSKILLWAIRCFYLQSKTYLITFENHFSSSFTMMRSVQYEGNLKQ